MKKMLISCLLINLLFIFILPGNINADSVDVEEEMVLKTVAEFINAFENKNIGRIKSVLSSDFITVVGEKYLNKDEYIDLIKDVLEDSIKYTFSDIKIVKKISDQEYKILGKLEVAIKGEPLTMVSVVFNAKNIDDNYYISGLCSL